ncbi:MAG: L-threonylcarbamoyladenylate synthase [Acidimicrobiia bacterium]
MNAEAVEALAAGRVVGVPTDTVYGLAADPFQKEALERLYELKGRPADRPVALLVASAAQARRVAELTPEAEELGTRYWPGPLTLVLRRSPDLPEWLGNPERDTVGVRVPDHPVALELLEVAGPLAVTSANRSGDRPVLAAEQAEALFGNRVAVYLPGVSPGGEASTVLDLTEGAPRVVRSGPLRIES